MATKPIKFLELHYTMTQFLMIFNYSHIWQDLHDDDKTILKWNLIKYRPLAGVIVSWVTKHLKWSCWQIFDITLILFIKFVKTERSFQNTLAPRVTPAVKLDNRFLVEPTELFFPLLHLHFRLPFLVQTQLLYLPTQIRFLIGGERVTCHWSKLNDALGRTKLNDALGKQHLELWTCTWSGRVPWNRGKFVYRSAWCKKPLK